MRYIENCQTSPTPALFVGKVVHSVLTRLYRHRLAGQICTTDDLPRLVADAWRRTLETDPCYFVYDTKEKKCLYQVFGLVTAYLTSIPLQEERPSAIEKHYEVPLLDPITGEDLGIPLVGIVDLVLHERGDSSVLIDFKTSSTSSPRELQHEIQLTAYAYLHREATGLNESRCEVRQLVKIKTPKVIIHRFPQRTEEHFVRFFGLIREYLEALDKGVYNYRPGWQCSICEHYGTCY
jgi:hypothetical protein